MHSFSIKAAVPQAALSVWRRLSHAGYRCLLAGGWVRDLCLGKSGHDVDLATSATPEEVMALFPRCLPLGQRFGSVIVLIQEGQSIESIEVTSFRQDGLYLDGRRPSQVLRGTPEQDAHRRDFTINGLFYDPATELVLDYVEGMQDLRRGLLRAIGNPRERFAEDRLRMLRAVRFATRLSLQVDPATASAILELSSTLTRHVSAERILQELSRMEQSGDLIAGLELMRGLGLLEALFGRRPCEEAVAPKLAPLVSDATMGLVRLLAALWPIREGAIDPECRHHLKGLKMAALSYKQLEHLDEGVALYWRDRECYDVYSWMLWLAKEPSGSAKRWLTHRLFDPFWQQQLEKLSCSPLMNALMAEGGWAKARELIALGARPGPAMGRVLKWLDQQTATLQLPADQRIAHLLSDPQGLCHLQEAR